jgi:predicted RNase H-like HicB family nuclease
VRFTISGRGYEITKQQVIESARGISPNIPDIRNKYYVEIRGEHYPIKQLIHLVTGLPNIQFNAGPAHLILQKLGFDIRTYGHDATPKTVDKGIGMQDTAKFAITLEEDEDGFIVASCPALPGCHSQGRTKAEAIANIREAIRGYIASMRKHGELIPSVKEVQEIEVPV